MPGHADIGGGEEPAAHRLPYSVEPRRYELRLAPDLESATFTGEVRIEATAHESLSEVLLNAAELTVLSAEVVAGDSKALAAEVRLDPDRERVALRSPEVLPAGPLEIRLEFAGVLNDQLHGFYRSTFVDAGENTRTIATTQFEATDARRAFPCFDEPDRKAVFAVSLDVPAGLGAFSNGPVVEDSPLPGGARRVRFADTIPMSSYLVAFVVGPLVATDPVDVDGVAVRVVHVPGKETLTAFALEAAAHSLEFFTEWFGLPYPAEKLDLLAIPDFAFGAMENLGCVTFREAVLLVDPARASRLELERVADVVSHEIAHMWFGDLVTMKWWNGIWLNEAFATFMELKCVDHFRPQWERWVSFGMERDAAMEIDALHTTRPVEYPVGPPEEAQGMFDVLTYQKGAGVLRMLEQYLGADRFRDGVRRYLSEHLLSNTETSDLWDAIEAASGEPVREIMDSWILQGGFPVVTAAEAGEEGDRAEPGARSSPRESTAGSAQRWILDQQPFSYSPVPPAGAESSIGSRWHVPVMVRHLGTGAPSDLRLLLGAQSLPLELDAAPPRGESGRAPLLLNARGSGYYRVSYPAAHLRRLAAVMGSLEPLERRNLLGDTWASVVALRSAPGEFLLLAEALGPEDHPDVWAPVTSALSFLDHAVDDAVRPQLAAYTRALLGPLLARLGWEAEEHEEERRATLRSAVLGTLGTVGEDTEVRARCSILEADYLAGRGSIDPDIAAAVAGVAASAGSEREFESFLDRYHHPATPQEEIRYLYALAGFESPALSRRAFELALGEVRTQNAPFLVQLLLSNRFNGPATWGRVSEHWEALVARVPSQTVPRMLEGAKLQCRDAALAGEIRGFLARHPLRTGQRTVQQMLERLEVNVAFSTQLRAVAGTELAAAVDRLGG
ncbi:MAG TPA: M1 family aminopeptidase [Acidimicrobiales bacterium]|nr:M1 family aminopeptidase [Acidimicrobiales bacterium]